MPSITDDLVTKLDSFSVTPGSISDRLRALYQARGAVRSPASLADLSFQLRQFDSNFYPGVSSPDPIKIPNPPLNLNPFFETDLSDWTAQPSATFTRVSGQGIQGSDCAQLTSNATSSVALLCQIPLQAGNSYLFAGMFKRVSGSIGAGFSINAVQRAFAPDITNWTYLSSVFVCTSDALIPVYVYNAVNGVSGTSQVGASMFIDAFIVRKI